MKKIIYMTLIMCLYSNITIAKYVMEEEVNPKDINVNEAWQILDFDKIQTGTAKIYKDHNSVLIKNYAEGYRDAIADSVTFNASSKTINCLTRPMKMFYDEIFDDYRKGEVSGSELFSKALKGKLEECKTK